jgi:MtN3 and saliva related transmembrane protein
VIATPLGFLAGALTTGAWLPQLIRTWRLRRAEDISTGYLGAFGAGVTGWVVYGILTGDTAIIVTNAVTLALLLGLAALKWHLLTRAAAGTEPGRDRRGVRTVDNH